MEPPRAVYIVDLSIDELYHHLDFTRLSEYLIKRLGDDQVIWDGISEVLYYAIGDREILDINEEPLSRMDEATFQAIADVYLGTNEVEVTETFRRINEQVVAANRDAIVNLLRILRNKKEEIVATYQYKHLLEVSYNDTNKLMLMVETLPVLIPERSAMIQ